jgi:hypothetical protein
MLPRRRPDAVHRVYAEEELGAGVEGPEAEGESLEPPGAWDEPVEPPFAGLATGLGRRNRVAAMALLGAVVGVFVVLLAHGMHAPAVGGDAARIPEAGSVVSVPASPARHREAPAVRQAVVVEARRVRDMPKARKVQAAPAIRAAAAPEAGDVASVTAAQQSAGSEFGFER